MGRAVNRCSVHDGDTHSSGELRRGMCRKHYSRYLRGTLGRTKPDVDDGVRSPADLTVRAKGARYLSDGRWAVAMPYPAFNGKQACAKYPHLYAEELHYQDPNTRERADLCARCTFRQSCAEWATAHEVGGYWGGLTVADREARRKARGQVLLPLGAVSEEVDHELQRR